MGALGMSMWRIMSLAGMLAILGLAIWIGVNHQECILLTASVHQAETEITKLRSVAASAEARMQQAEAALQEERRKQTENSQLCSAVCHYYDIHGEWANIFYIESILDFKIVESKGSERRAHVRYKYRPMPNNPQGRTDTGEDHRIFRLNVGERGAYSVIEMGGYLSADSDCIPARDGKQAPDNDQF